MKTGPAGLENLYAGMAGMDELIGLYHFYIEKWWNQNKHNKNNKQKCAELLRTNKFSVDEKCMLSNKNIFRDTVDQWFLNFFPLS